MTAITTEAPTFDKKFYPSTIDLQVEDALVEHNPTLYVVNAHNVIIKLTAMEYVDIDWSIVHNIEVTITCERFAKECLLMKTGVRGAEFVEIPAGYEDLEGFLNNYNGPKYDAMDGSVEAYIEANLPDSE